MVGLYVGGLWGGASCVLGGRQDEWEMTSRCMRVTETLYAPWVWWI
jgi:hypothetical protein